MSIVKSIIPYFADLKEIKALGEEDGMTSLIKSAIVTRPVFEDTINELAALCEDNNLFVADPSPFNLSSIGVSNIGVGDNLGITTDGQILAIQIEKRERIIPNDVVNRITSERVTKEQEETGERVPHIRKQEIKSMVRDELMPKALIKARIAYAIFFNKGDKAWFMIVNASGKFEDEVFKFIKDKVFNPAVMSCYMPIDHKTLNGYEYYLKKIISLSTYTPYNDVEKQIEKLMSPMVEVKAKHNENGSVSIKDYSGNGFDNFVTEYLEEGYEVTSLYVRSECSSDDFLDLEINSKGRFSKFSCGDLVLVDRVGEIEGYAANFFAECLIFGQEVIAQSEMIRKVCGTVEEIKE